MNNYKTKYEGTVVGLIKALKVESLSQMLELEVELCEDVNYLQIDFDQHGTRNKSKQVDPLGALIIKVGSVNTCKYAFSEAACLNYNDLLQDMYTALFERSPELVREVLTHLVENYSAEELMPKDPYSKKAESQYQGDKIEFFRPSLDIMWNNTELTPMLENLKILNDHLTPEKEIFQLANLLEVLKPSASFEDFKVFKNEILNFLIKYDYSLDYGVAPHFLCMCHNDPQVFELFDHLDSKNPDFKGDLMIYIARQFLSKESRNSELDSLSYQAIQNEEVSFIDNPKFVKFLVANEVFPSTIDTSLESLAKAHFDFVASGRKEYSIETLMNVKPSESLVSYLRYLDYDKKKLFLKAIASNEKVQDCINGEWCGILEEYLFDNKAMRNFGISFHLANNYDATQKKEKVKEVLSTLAQLPFNFQEKVSSILDVKLAQMNETQQKEYFDMMVPTDTKAVNRVKI